jgi:uncharacterized protein (TIGR02145 family)
VISGTATFGNADSENTTVTLTSNTIIRANFVQTYILTIDQNLEAGGTFTPASGLNHDVNIPISITATPASGYGFVNWTVTSASGTATFANANDAATTVSLSSNATIRANFQQAITDQRDGRVYRIVTIGTQTWMAENLNFNANGSVCYNNSPDSCAKYGRLYDWSTAMELPSSCNSSSCANQVQSRHRGICPVGWHVPSDAEWTTLVNFVTNGTGGGAGARLKSTTGWNSGGNGTDDFGFSALPGGIGWSGVFTVVGSFGSWWNATEHDASNARRRIIESGVSHVNSGSSMKFGLFSLRCVKDDAAP